MTDILARIKSLSHTEAALSGITKLDVLRHDKLTALARSLGCIQRSRIIDPANVAVSMIAFTANQGNCQSEGFSVSY